MTSNLDCESHKWRVGCEVCLAQPNKDYNCKKCDRSTRVCMDCKKVCVKKKIEQSGKHSDVRVGEDNPTGKSKTKSKTKVAFPATAKPKAEKIEKFSYKIEKEEESSDNKSQILKFVDFSFHSLNKSTLKKLHDLWNKMFRKKLSTSAFHALVLLIQITFLDVMDIALCLQLTYQTGPSSQFKKTKSLEECFPFKQTKMHHYPKWTLFFEKFINQSIEEAKKKLPSLIQKTDCFGVREYDLMRVEMSMAHQQQETAASLCDDWIVRYLLPPRLQFDEQKRVKKFAYLLDEVFRGTRCLPPLDIDNIVNNAFVDTKEILRNYPAHAEKFISDPQKEELHELYLQLPEVKRKLVQQPQKIAKPSIEELIVLFSKELKTKLPSATTKKISASYKKELVQLLQKEFVLQKRKFANQIFNEILQKKVQEEPPPSSQALAVLINQAAEDTLATVDPADPGDVFYEKKKKKKKLSQKDQENLLCKNLWNFQIEAPILMGLLPPGFSKNQINLYNQSSSSKFLEAEEYFEKKKKDKAMKSRRTGTSSTKSVGKFQEREREKQEETRSLPMIEKIKNLSLSRPNRSGEKDKQAKDKIGDGFEKEEETMDDEEQDEEDEEENDAQIEEMDEEEEEGEETSDHEEG